VDRKLKATHIGFVGEVDDLELCRMPVKIAGDVLQIVPISGQLGCTLEGGDRDDFDRLPLRKATRKNVGYKIAYPSLKQRHASVYDGRIQQRAVSIQANERRERARVGCGQQPGHNVV